MSDLGATLDRLAARAWPALETEVRDGWWLRYNEGLHRRVNSVFPEKTGTGPLDTKIAEAEAYYRAHGLPPRFQITSACRPADLDAILAARGYAVESGVDIMTAEAASLTQVRGSGARVEIAAALTPQWLDVHMAEAAAPETKARKGRMLERIERVHAFALAFDAGRPVAAGLGIFEDGWTGVFGMFTLADARRRGHGHAVLAALAEWTLAQSGRRTYLQVERDNPGALAVYAKLGFGTVHGYHYRTLWPVRPGAST